jgi:hypothetical protein
MDQRERERRMRDARIDGDRRHQKHLHVLGDLGPE